MDITCIILAGGKALRLGQDKLQQTVGRRSLLEEVVSRTRAVCKDTIVVTSQERAILPTNGSAGLKVVRDLVPGKGPLGGVHAGLAASETFYNFVFAGDMPFLNEVLLTYMVESADAFDLVIPNLDGLVEPLHAIYSKSCLAPIKYLMNQDRLSVHQLLPLVNVRYITAEEINRFDPEHLSFFNINTRADLDKARQMAKRIPGYD